MWHGQTATVNVPKSSDDTPAILIARVKTGNKLIGEVRIPLNVGGQVREQQG